MRFSNEIIFIGRSFVLSQALSFESLDYVIDHSRELHLFGRASLEDNESPMSIPLIGLMRADLEELYPARSTSV
jgi:hypothetical protein